MINSDVEQFLNSDVTFSNFMNLLSDPILNTVIGEEPLATTLSPKLMDLNAVNYDKNNNLLINCKGASKNRRNAKKLSKNLANIGLPMSLNNASTMRSPSFMDNLNKPTLLHPDIKSGVILNSTTHKRIFACRACGEVFKRAQHLNEHFRQKHPLLKPYQCIRCKKEFTRADNLGLHQLECTEND